MVEQVIIENFTTSYIMVGPHYVNLIEVRRLDELDPREPSKEQHKKLVEDLVVPL